MPAAAKVHLEPGGEVHGLRRSGNPDVTQIARAITRGNIHTPTESDRKMGVIATDTHALIVGFERGLGRTSMLVAKRKMPMHEIANRLHARPAQWRLPEQRPCRLGESIGFAVAAPE